MPIVCIGVLEKIDAGLDAKAKKNKLAIEEAIEIYCTRKDIDNKEKKLCYFLKPIKRDVSQPFSTGMPKAKVCERLKKKSAEICTIKYRKYSKRGKETGRVSVLLWMHVELTKNNDASLPPSLPPLSPSPFSRQGRQPDGLQQASCQGAEGYPI